MQQGLLESCLWDREAAGGTSAEDTGECDVINNVADLCEEEVEGFQRPDFVCDESRSKPTSIT